MSPSRRRTLSALSGVALFGLAGCTELFGDDEEPTPDNGENGNDNGNGENGNGNGNGDDPVGSLELIVAGPAGEATFFDADDIAEASGVHYREEHDEYEFPLWLSEEGLDRARQAFLEVEAHEDPAASSIAVLIDDEEAISYGVGSNFARSIEESTWDGRFVLRFEDEETAEAARDRV